MNNWDKYVFIYRNAIGNWREDKDPVSIAIHLRCRAIKRKKLLERFSSVSQFINRANDYFDDEKADAFIRETSLKEIADGSSILEGEC